MVLNLASGEACTVSSIWLSYPETKGNTAGNLRMSEIWSRQCVGSLYCTCSDIWCVTERFHASSLLSLAVPGIDRSLVQGFNPWIEGPEES